MRDLAILEEWLTKVRAEKRDCEHRYCLASDGDNAIGVAREVELCTKIIEGIRLLDKDAGEFVKRNLG